ncbi:MAG TPA: SMC-Scp complex subunit ScpB [Arachidicoccus sp.]|nr:SMC-Scp complex subunit ScpB [Arachidicoccus sp.]
MELSEIIPHIEALIFASERPLTSLEIVDLINNAFGFMEQQISLDQVETALEGIREKYNSDFYPFEVFQSGGGWQFLSKPSFHTTIAQLNGGKFLKKLSNSALETLSIIAYKQPITKGEIESIRGVNSDYSVQKLLEKELVIISGRNEELPGKPLIYETSKSFMDYFGLNSADDLPKIREVLAERIEPTAQQRNVEEDEDFGIFKKEQAQKETSEYTTAVAAVSSTGAGVETDVNIADTDLEEAEESEIADQQLRESLAGDQQDMEREFKVNLEVDLDETRTSDNLHSNPSATEDQDLAEEADAELATLEEHDAASQPVLAEEELDEFSLPAQNDRDGESEPKSEDENEREAAIEEEDKAPDEEEELEDINEEDDEIDEEDDFNKEEDDDETNEEDTIDEDEETDDNFDQKIGSKY